MIYNLHLCARCKTLGIWESDWAPKGKRKYKSFRDGNHRKERSSLDKTSKRSLSITTFLSSLPKRRLFSASSIAELFGYCSYQWIIPNFSSIPSCSSKSFARNSGWWRSRSKGRERNGHATHFKDSEKKEKNKSQMDYLMTIKQAKKRKWSLVYAGASTGKTHLCTTGVWDGEGTETVWNKKLFVAISLLTTTFPSSHSVFSFHLPRYAGHRLLLPLQTRLHL